MFFNFFKRKKNSEAVTSKVEAQNDVSEMKDGLPLVHENVLEIPKLFKVVSVNTDRTHELVGSEISVVISNNDYDETEYSGERGFIVLKKDNKVIKAKEI